MMRKNRTMVYLSLLSFLLALVWMGVSVVSTVRKTVIPADIEKVIEPLEVNLDKRLLETIANRRGR